MPALTMLILRATAREIDAERPGLGVIKVVPKQDAERVLEEVQGACGFNTGFEDRPIL